MKLLLISDIHNAARYMEWIYKSIEHHQPDLVICLGDFVTNGPVSFVVDIFKRLSDIASKVFWIPGNHDPIDTHLHLEHLPIVNLHNQRVEFGGFHFVGKGGSLPCPVKTHYEETEFEITASIADILQQGDILCLHNPIWGYRDAITEASFNFHKHIGSKALCELVEARKPYIVFSGHVHMSMGVDLVGPVWFLNPGAVVDGLAALVELSNNKLVRAHFLRYPDF